MPAGALLVIEASTASGSVAIVSDGRVLAHSPVAMGASREDALFPAVQRLLSQCGLTPASLAGIVCGAGPGSFTSLRIAGSLSKGLAHGGDLALYAVSSLLLALANAGLAASPGSYVVHGDALRGERYALRARVDSAGCVFATGAVQRVLVTDLASYAEGSGLVAVASSLSPEHELVIVVPDASGVLAVGDWTGCGPLSLADWEPAYGRLAEAQVVWEARHGHALPVA